jgi:endonuclease/exonuclease/phosphatase (EEP) superfamily protein YafD
MTPEQQLKQLASELEQTNRDLLAIAELTYTSNAFVGGIRQRIDRLAAVQHQRIVFDRAPAPRDRRRFWIF